jgi:hypothetical protein
MATSVSDWLDRLHPSLRPLWDLENELRKAAQNAIFLRNEEAKKHLDEARRHYKDALAAIHGGSSAPPAADVPAKSDQAPFSAPAVPPQPSGHNPN